ncbi:retroviral-like aspartic protease family protein [Singulisphaera rosea]
MEVGPMGKAVVSAKIENIFDVKKVDRGSLASEQVRRVDVEDARIDTGATLLAMPKKMIEQLGLRHVETKPAKTAAGVISVGIHQSVRLTVQGRSCEIRVTEVNDSRPVSIGYIPLEMLDFVVDPKGQRLIGNPDHCSEHMFDLY